MRRKVAIFILIISLIKTERLVACFIDIRLLRQASTVWITTTWVLRSLTSICIVHRSTRVYGHKCMDYGLWISELFLKTGKPIKRRSAQVWQGGFFGDLCNFQFNATTSSSSVYLWYLNKWKLTLVTMFKNKLLTKVVARTNGLRHENHCIKRPSHLWRFCFTLSVRPFLVVNALVYVDIDQGIHWGEKA